MIKSIKEQWIVEEVEESYKFLISFSNFLIATSIISRVCDLIFSPSPYLFETIIPWTIMHILVTLSIKVVQSKSKNYKIAASLFYAEYFNIVCKGFADKSLKNQYSITELFAFLIVSCFQFSVMKNKLAFNLLAIKFMYLWEIHDRLFNFKAIEESHNPAHLWISITLLINVWHSWSNKVSFERFSYKLELENTKKRLNTVTESFSDGFLIISENIKIEFLNSYAQELLGCSFENLRTSIMQIEYLQNKKVCNFGTSNFLKDDLMYLLSNWYLEEATLGFVFLQNNNIEFKAKQIFWENKHALFLTIRNVNQSIELEKKIANDRMKNLLLRSVSHELRTPLNSIIYFTNELISKFYDKPLADYKQLKIIWISSKLMLSLINDIVDYTKLLSGAFTIQKSHCNIREVVRQVYELFNIQAIKKQISVIVRVDPSIPELIYTDSIRLNQILLNLMSNAFKNTLRGKIEICCVSTVNNKMRISVQDSGIGMNKEFMDSLLRNLNILNAPALNSNGTGLGLYISNLLIKQLGGKRLKINSNLGKGSTFSFSIAIFENNLLTGTHEKIESNFSEDYVELNSEPRFFLKSRQKDVLIVDDTEFNLEVLSSILKKNKISYEEASNGKIALEKVIKQDSIDQPYKVIIMDCEMPEMNGWKASEYIETLFRQGKLRCLPHIIGHSAYNSEEDIRLCYQSGMVYFLPKPCCPEKLVNVVRNYLNC
ncbi:unnamed protein product [Blepharisma stoltei]|uniref:Histidine kinase n=1 Tax=Blepharisma stoltei TaxID=1481888 RepID=A0AAU9J8I8_9CILI|nr:unnamed protein product [Blepharisma stoltei]